MRGMKLAINLLLALTLRTEAWFSLPSTFDIRAQPLLSPLNRRTTLAPLKSTPTVTAPPASVERSNIDLPWIEIEQSLRDGFGLSDDELKKYQAFDTDKKTLLGIYDSMLMAR